MKARARIVWEEQVRWLVIAAAAFVVLTGGGAALGADEVFTHEHIAKLHSVGSVRISPDGKLVASVSRDRTVKVWEAATGCTVTSLFFEHPDLKVAFVQGDPPTLLVGEYGGNAVGYQLLKGYSSIPDAAWEITPR